MGRCCPPDVAAGTMSMHPTPTFHRRYHGHCHFWASWHRHQLLGVICRAKADSGAAAPPAALGAAQALESLHLALHPALRKCWDGVVASQVCEAFRGDAALTVRRKRLHACAASLEKD